MVWGPDGLLPSAARCRIGTSYFLGSAALGETIVHGGSTIYFLQNQIQAGISTALNCYYDFIRSRSETSEVISSAIKTEAYKKCVSATQSLAFAVTGGTKMATSAMRSYRARVADQAAQLEMTERGREVNWHNLREHVAPVAENTKAILKDLPPTTITAEGKVLRRLLFMILVMQQEIRKGT